MPEFSRSEAFARIEDISTVISILPIGISEKKPGLVPGEYSIPPVNDPMKDINVLIVSRARFPVYIDENRPSLIVPEPSDRVCDSICRDFSIGLMGYEPGKAEPGLTWISGNHGPVEIESKMPDQMKLLRARQMEWFKNLVTIADDDWSKLHMRRAISGLQRVACRCLNLDREWNIDIEIEKQLDIDMTPCKFCRAPIHHEAIVCMHCQGILNIARYKKEFVSAEVLTSIAADKAAHDPNRF